MTITLVGYATLRACDGRVKCNGSRVALNRYGLTHLPLFSGRLYTYLWHGLTGKSLPSRKLLPWLQPLHALQLIF